MTSSFSHTSTLLKWLSFSLLGAILVSLIILVVEKLSHQRIRKTNQNHLDISPHRYYALLSTGFMILIFHCGWIILSFEVAQVWLWLLTMVEYQLMLVVLAQPPAPTGTYKHYNNNNTMRNGALFMAKIRVFVYVGIISTSLFFWYFVLIVISLLPYISNNFTILYNSDETHNSSLMQYLFYLNSIFSLYSLFDNIINFKFKGNIKMITCNIFLFGSCIINLYASYSVGLKVILVFHSLILCGFIFIALGTFLGWARNTQKSKNNIWKRASATVIGASGVGKTRFLRALISQRYVFFFFWIVGNFWKFLTSLRKISCFNFFCELLIKNKPELVLFFLLKFWKTLCFVTTTHSKHKNNKTRQNNTINYAWYNDDLYNEYHLKERYYYSLPSINCEIAFWDTVGDCRFYQNIFSSIARSNITLVMYHLTIKQEEKSQEKMAKSMQFILEMDHKLQKYFDEKIECLLVGVIEIDDKDENIPDYNENSHAYDQCHQRQLEILNEATKTFKFADNNPFIVQTKIKQGNRNEFGSRNNAASITRLNENDNEKSSSCCRCCGICDRGGCMIGLDTQSDELEKHVSKELEVTQVQLEQDFGKDNNAKPRFNIRLVTESVEHSDNDNENENDNDNCNDDDYEISRVLSPRERIVSQIDIDTYFEISNFENLLIEIGNYCDNNRNRRISKPRATKKIKWWNGFLIRQSDWSINTNNDKIDDDDDGSNVNVEDDNLEIYWGLRRSQIVRPSAMETCQMFGTFIGCLICILFSPIVFVMQNVVFWLYSESNQLFCNQFVSYIIQSIDINITHSIVFYDFLYVLFKANHPDPHLRHEMSNIANENSISTTTSDNITHNNSHLKSKKTNLSYLYVTSTTLKIYRSLFSFILIILTTMSGFNFAFWLLNKDSTDRDDLSAYELTTGPVWLFLIGIIVSSWYCYSVRIVPSINSSNAATEGETLKFRYVDTSSSKFDIITSNIAAFASNCNIYNTKEEQKTKLQEFLHRKNIMSGIVIGLVLAIEPPLVRMLFYIFGISDSEDSSYDSTTSDDDEDSRPFIYILVPKGAEIVVVFAAIINFLFIFVAQFAFWTCIQAKVEIYRKLMTRITTIIELPMKNAPKKYTKQNSISHRSSRSRSQVNRSKNSFSVSSRKRNSNFRKPDSGSTVELGSVKQNDLNESKNDDETEFKTPQSPKDHETATVQHKKHIRNQSQASITWNKIKNKYGLRFGAGKEFDKIRTIDDDAGFEFLSLEDPNNLIAFAEMREYCYLNGMKIFGDLELSVLIIGLCVSLMAITVINDIIFDTEDGIASYGETRIARLLIFFLVISWIVEIMSIGFDFDDLQQRQIEAINTQLQCILLNYQNRKTVCGFGSWVTQHSNCWKTLKSMIKYPQIYFDNNNSNNNKDDIAMYNAKFNVEKRKFDQHIETLKYFVQQMEQRPLNPTIFGYSLTGAMLNTLIFSMFAPFAVFLIQFWFLQD